MDYLYRDKDDELTIEELAKKWNDEIVERLIAYRERLHKTRQDVADAIGLTLSEVELMESKGHSSPIWKLKRYAEYLRVDLSFDKIMSESASERLPLPVGISDFRRVSANCCYVDKTMLIKEILDESAVVTLFTRPRRFGKTLNMDMLRVFFEKTEEDTSVYFRDKKIWKCGDKYCRHQGQYPVICLTFKDIKLATWEENIKYIKLILATEFNRHPELFQSDKCNEFEKRYFEKVACAEATEIELTQALLILSRMLSKHHGKQTVIIIDEYDTPIQQGYVQGYYSNAVTFMRILFSGGFKDNSYLYYGFLTGILRVAKESIFSGLNNLKVNSVLQHQYSEYFGFTATEVRKLAVYYDVPAKYYEIRKWYDGYRFGKTDIFNPWSVIGYFNAGCEASLYWVSTGSNDIIGEILKEATEDVGENLYKLMRGEAVFTQIDTGVIYPEVRKNPTSVYSFLLVAGYLKVANPIKMTGGECLCEVAIPNKEIFYVYQKEILAKLTDVIPPSTVLKIHEAIHKNDADSLQRQLRKLLLQTVSYNDAASESFYHGLVLGLCAMLDNQYYVTSNRESGEGRFDIQLMPREKELPGILIEVKAEKECDKETLKNLANKALEQIKIKHYDVDMRMRRINKIFKYGVAFSGKRVEIATELIYP